MSKVGDGARRITYVESTLRWIRKEYDVLKRKERMWLCLKEVPITEWMETVRVILGILEGISDLGEYVKKWELLMGSEVDCITFKCNDDSYWLKTYYDKEYVYLNALGEIVPADEDCWMDDDWIGELVKLVNTFIDNYDVIISLYKDLLE